jgi:hypothetical protein
VLVPEKQNLLVVLEFAKRKGDNNPAEAGHDEATDNEARDRKNSRGHVVPLIL